MSKRGPTRDAYGRPRPSHAGILGWVLMVGVLLVAVPALAEEVLHPPKLITADAEDILKAVQSSKARAVMVNVWATFCQPCREEFPDLMKLYQNYKEEGFGLILVSADFPNQVDAARSFLASQGVTFDSFLKEGKDGAFIEGMGRQWSGAIPATWIYSAEGEVVKFWEGKASYKEFERAIRPMLDTAR